MTFRMMGLPEELRLGIEEASGSDTEQARLIYEAAVNEAVGQVTNTVNQSLREVQSIIGPHGTITRLQTGGIRIANGEGIGVYLDGVFKTNIQPNGTVVIGSDITRAATTTEIFFVEDTAYNGEMFGAGDFLIGDNSQSNVKYDASEGQLQFRSGSTVKAYMDTDGSLKAGDGNVILTSDGIIIQNQTDSGDAFIIFKNSNGTALGEIYTSIAGNLELVAFGDVGAERKLILRSQIDDGATNIATIEIVANVNDTGIDLITLNSDQLTITTDSINTTSDNTTFYATLADTTTRYLAWREHPTEAGTALLEIDGGSTAANVRIGNDIILRANKDGTETVFNERSNDIDFRIEGATDTAVLKVDAGLNKLYQNGYEPAWSLIEDKLLGADTASFDFMSIPATFKSLKIVLSARTDRAANSDKINLKVNNDGTAGNYFCMVTALYHSGAQSSEEFLGSTVPVPVGYALANTSPTSGFAEYEITFVDYANANKLKDFQVRGGGRFDTGTGNFQMFDGIGQWASTTAISQITLTPNLGTNFKQHSRATLYGLR
jgi:hypothetical protein